MSNYFCESLERRVFLDGLTPAPEGQATTFMMVQSADDNPNPWMIGWGDGNSDTVSMAPDPDYPPDWGMLEGDASHTYLDSGDYEVSLGRDDGSGQVGWGSQGTITIPDTAPSATVASTFDENNDALNLTLTNPSDPSPADTNAGFHYSAATNFDDLAQSYNDASDTPQMLHLNSQQVVDHDGWLRIFDQDGGYRDYNPIIPVPDLAVVATGYTATSLSWQDVLPSAPAYRISQSTDGVNWSIYKDIDRADLTFSDDLITYNDTGLEDGTNYSYRVRALDLGGNGNETAYAPAKSVVTPLSPPTDIMATNVNNAAHDIDVSWSLGSTHYDHVVLSEYAVTDGVIDTTPIQTLTLDGNATTHTFGGNGANANYAFGAHGTNSSASSTQTDLVENQDAPTSDWTNVVWDNQKGAQAPNVTVDWSPMQTGTDEEGHDYSYVGDYENDQTVTLTVSNLPRHTWAKVGGYIEASGLANDDLHPYFDVTVTGGDVQVNSNPTWTGGPSWISGIWGFSPGENTGGDPDAFKHDSKNLTISITAHGLNDEEYNSWRWTPHVYADTFLPIVSLSGGGTVIEDGTGKATFTAHRTGGGTVISEPLVVKVKDTGGGAEDAATPGQNYEPITEIVIPAGQNDGSVDVHPINTDEAEGLEGIYLSVDEKPIYALAAPPVAAPATGPTSAKAGKNDEPRVDRVVVSVYVDPNTPPIVKRENLVNGYDFLVRIDVFGEAVDQIQIQQKINSSTVVTKSDGTTAYTAQELPQLSQVTQNSNGWALDEHINANSDWPNLQALDAKKSQASIADHHSFEIATNQVPYGNQMAKICNFIYVTRYLQDRFRDGREGHHDAQLGAVDWGFSWSNWNTKWQVGDVPAPPSGVVSMIACDKKDTGKGYFFGVQTITGLDF